MKAIYFLIYLNSFWIWTSCAQQNDGLQLQKDSIDFEERLIVRSSQLRLYLKDHSEYNSDTGILIDMKQQSGKFRCFVVDLKTSQITHRGLVAHGAGSETGTEDSLVFSNIPDSHCTSLGKYRIGEAYIGSFGRSYKLHGLEATNDKAFERFVVLHRYSCVPDNEQIDPICNSLGCPMVSELFFEELDEVIRSSEKPIILEVFY